MKKTPARYAAYTGVLLALCVFFQSAGRLIPALAAFKIMGPFDVSVLLVGSLVNLTLIVATWSVGFWSGAAIALLAPIIAFLQGFQALLPMVAVIFLGNLTLVALCHLMRRQRAAGVALGAVCKAAALYLLVTLLVVPLFVETGSPQSTALPILFSWPQLVTALLGGGLALLIVPRLEKGMR